MTDADTSNRTDAPARPLRGAVAVVTGASRGIGKGIALELGAAGGTVYVTGRSTRPDPHGLPGTVTDTAEAVTAAGGLGVAVVCDHRDDAQVRELFARVAEEQHRLDILVNNVFSSPDLAPWLGRRFWEIPIEAWDQIIGVGARSHYVASALGLGLMRDSREPSGYDGLVVNISSSGAVTYGHNVLYGVGKAAVDKMTADMARELADEPITVVSLWPGLVRTELVEHGARRDGDRLVLDLPGEGTFDLACAESPRFTGRAVVALATHPDARRYHGQAVPVAELAGHYGFTDVDGTVPTPPLRAHR